MNYSNISSKDQNEIMADLARKKAIIQKNRESKEVLAKNHEMQGPRIFMYDGNKSLMSSFKAVSLVQDHAQREAFAFPLDLGALKLHSLAENLEETKGFDPNAINLKMRELVLMVHGSLESKPKIIDDFNEQNPECSKNSIEKKLKEAFIKDKRNDDPRQRYYATDETLQNMQTEFPDGRNNQQLIDLAR